MAYYDDPMKLPPKDSWIMLKAGEAVEIGPELQKEWQQKTQECRRIRGAVLAAAFEIEYTLDHLLTEIFLPNGESLKVDSEWEHPTVKAKREDLRSQFDQRFLKSGILSFSDKIKVLRKLISELPHLAKLVPAELQERLNKTRDLRNRFAHYPVTFTVVGERPTQSLHAVLVCKDKEIVLDSAFLNEAEALLSSASKDIEQVLKRVIVRHPANLDTQGLGF